MPARQMLSREPILALQFDLSVQMVAAVECHVNAILVRWDPINVLEETLVPVVLNFVLLQYHRGKKRIS